MTKEIEEIADFMLDSEFIEKYEFVIPDDIDGLIESQENYSRLLGRDVSLEEIWRIQTGMSVEEYLKESEGV